jgi:hypothetical protein
VNGGIPARPFSANRAGGVQSAIRRTHSAWYMPKNTLKVHALRSRSVADGASPCGADPAPMTSRPMLKPLTFG